MVWLLWQHKEAGGYCGSSRVGDDLLFSWETAVSQDWITRPRFSSSLSLSLSLSVNTIIPVPESSRKWKYYFVCKVHLHMQILAEDMFTKQDHVFNWINWSHVVCYCQFSWKTLFSRLELDHQWTVMYYRLKLHFLLLVGHLQCAFTVSFHFPWTYW